MELVIMSSILVILAISSIGAALFIAFLVGLLYSKSYYDGAENTGSRKWPAFQRLITNITYPIQRHYFDYNIRYATVELKGYIETILADADATITTIIFSGHPHGLVAINSFFNVGCWHRVVPCVHRHVFAIPGVRELALWLGAIDVTRENITEKLKTRSVYIAAGGCREMILSPDALQRKHQGFLRLAFSLNKPVVPLIHLGQERAFRSYSCAWLDKIRHVVLDITGYPFPTFCSPPLPVTLTTHVFPLHWPTQYGDEKSFIDAYYELLQSHYDTLNDEKKRQSRSI